MLQLRICAPINGGTGTARATVVDAICRQGVAAVDKEIVANMKKFGVRFVATLSFIGRFQMAVDSLVLNLTSPVCTS
jgi:hypothetical protein